MQKVALNIDGPDQETYKALAKAFRIPYWDWARRDTQIVPQQALDATYGKDLNPNPLFTYKFPSNTTRDITVSTLALGVRGVGPTKCSLSSSIGLYQFYTKSWWSHLNK